MLVWRNKVTAVIPKTDIQSVNLHRSAAYSSRIKSVDFKITVTLKVSSAHPIKTLKLPVVFGVEQQASDAAALLAKIFNAPLIQDEVF